MLNKIVDNKDKVEDKIRTIVIDDEKGSLEQICGLVEDTGFMSVQNRYQDPMLALNEIMETSPQIAFIDIGMPEMDGLTLAERLLEKLPSMRVVFITGWNQYAVQAFDINALDYIMKPIRRERFNTMAGRIRTEIYERTLQNTQNPQSLIIKMFDRLETSIDGVPIKWQRTKALELFAYLLMNHGEYIHKDTILENLWPDCEPSKALPILQTSACRIRNVFSNLKQNVKLDYSGGQYCLIVRNAQCDLFTVEQAIYDFDKTNDASIRALEKACVLFGGGLLSQQGFIWSMERDEQLRDSLIRLLKSAATAYSVRNDVNNRLNMLKFIALLAPDDEEANYIYLKSLEKAGKCKELVNHCKRLSRMFKEEYDIIPARQLSELIERYKDR